MTPGGHVNISQKLVWNVYAGAAGVLATLVATQAVTKVWQLTTGDEPPEPNDPEVPLRRAHPTIQSVGF